MFTSVVIGIHVCFKAVGVQLEPTAIFSGGYTFATWRRSLTATVNTWLIARRPETDIWYAQESFKSVPAYLVERGTPCPCHIGFNRYSLTIALQGWKPAFSVGHLPLPLLKPLALRVPSLRSDKLFAQACQGCEKRSSPWGTLDLN